MGLHPKGNTSQGRRYMTCAENMRAAALDRVRTLMSP